MIRNGEKYSFVEASIFCPENPEAVDGNIIVSREYIQMAEILAK